MTQNCLNKKTIEIFFHEKYISTIIKRTNVNWTVWALGLRSWLGSNLSTAGRPFLSFFPLQDIKVKKCPVCPVEDKDLSFSPLIDPEILQKFDFSTSYSIFDSSDTILHYCLLLLSCAVSSFTIMRWISGQWNYPHKNALHGQMLYSVVYSLFELLWAMRWSRWWGIRYKGSRCIL